MIQKEEEKEIRHFVQKDIIQRYKLLVRIALGVQMNLRRINELT